MRSLPSPDGGRDWRPDKGGTGGRTRAGHPALFSFLRRLVAGQGWREEETRYLPEGGAGLVCRGEARTPGRGGGPVGGGLGGYFFLKIAPRLPPGPHPPLKKLLLRSVCRSPPLSGEGQAWMLRAVWFDPVYQGRERRGSNGPGRSPAGGTESRQSAWYVIFYKIKSDGSPDFGLAARGRGAYSRGPLRSCSAVFWP